jgi:hypothetical protein
VLARGARFTLGRGGIAEIEIYLSQPRANDGIIRCLANRVAQLDLGGLEVSFS